MTSPRFTFFVELTNEPLVELFDRPEVIDFLARWGCAIAMGLLDLSGERTAVVRRLEAAGIPVTAWLLLDEADGYWLNADNVEHARRRYLQAMEWAASGGLRLHRIGLDIEFPRNDGDLLMRSPLRGLLTLLRRRRAAAKVHAAEHAYAELVAEIRAGGRPVETYHFPHLLDERAAQSTLLRRTLGLVDVRADAEVLMLYSSYLGRAVARAYFADAQCIALGVTGGGVNAVSDREHQRLLSWERLEDDIRAAAHFTDEVYIFSLEGCVEQRMLERLAAMEWPADDRHRGAAAWRGARRWRDAFRWFLRAEPLFDRLYPSRSGA